MLFLRTYHQTISPEDYDHYEFGEITPAFIFEIDLLPSAEDLMLFLQPYYSRILRIMMSEVRTKSWQYLTSDWGDKKVNQLPLPLPEFCALVKQIFVDFVFTSRLFVLPEVWPGFGSVKMDGRKADPTCVGTLEVLAKYAPLLSKLYPDDTTTQSGNSSSSSSGGSKKPKPDPVRRLQQKQQQVYHEWYMTHHQEHLYVGIYQRFYKEASKALHHTHCGKNSAVVDEETGEVVHGVEDGQCHFLTHDKYNHVMESPAIYFVLKSIPLPPNRKANNVNYFLSPKNHKEYQDANAKHAVSPTNKHCFHLFKILRTDMVETHSTSKVTFKNNHPLGQSVLAVMVYSLCAFGRVGSSLSNFFKMFLMFCYVEAYRVATKQHSYRMKSLVDIGYIQNHFDKRCDY